MRAILLILVLLVGVVSADAATLQWQDNSDNEQGFSIERKAEPCAVGVLPFNVVGLSGANLSTYLDPVTAPGTYCYRVNAFNAAGASGYSNLAEFVIVPPPPPPPPPACGGTGPLCLGVTVQTSTELNVRKCAGLGCAFADPLKRSQKKGVRGVIRSGPVMVPVTLPNGQVIQQEWYEVEWPTTPLRGFSARSLASAIYVVEVMPMSISVTVSGTTVTVKRRATNTGLPAELLVDPSTTVTITP